MRRQAFVTNEAIIAIALGMLWVGIALPLYARLIRHLTRDGAHLPWQGHVLVLILAGAVPPLAVALLVLTERLVTGAWKLLSRRK